MKKETKIYLILVVIVVLIIVIIMIIRGNENPDEKLMKCIAGNSILIVKKGCEACTYQKQILGNYIDYFEIIDCTTNVNECIKYDITGVPAWIINETKYPGVQSIEQLKELTGCQDTIEED